jgi:hypothetical protein
MAAMIFIRLLSETLNPDLCLDFCKGKGKIRINLHANCYA